jgi:LytS/YehU family sensor histidine kinase
MPLLKLLITSFCASWILAIPLAFINIYLDHWTFPISTPVDVSFTSIYDYCVHIVRGLVPWMTIYIFYIYIEKLKVVEVEKYQLQAELKEDQLRYLKNQVNPHFLFNSLNSIRTLVDIDPEESKRTITNLSKFLRNTLVKSELSTIPLEDELQIVQDYLSLEKVRFDERLQVHFAIGAETLDYKIPPMVVQTLVENAIKHGISKLKKGGIINIRSYLEDKQLIISIENSGTYNGLQKSEGVGMKNTEQRLRLLFGHNASVTINNTNHGTVLTCIKLPV